MIEPMFEGKVAVVTGAAHGFGRSISVELAKRGATVVSVDILERELAETLKEVEAAAQFGGGGHVYKVDVTNEIEVNSCIEWTVSKFGHVDIVVNNAGGVLGQKNKPIEQVSAKEWEDIVNVNLTGAFYFVRAAAPYMKKQNYGRIVNVSSGAGRSFSLTGIQAYASSKAGQIGFTRQIASELGKFNITANNVAPGFVRCNPSTEKQWHDMGEQAQKNLVESIALRRLGKAEEIAYAVLFFASDYASYISGQVISVDGGKQMF